MCGKTKHKILLTKIKISINDICEIARYTNVSYFYTIFKMKYGISPNEYSKQK